MSFLEIKSDPEFPGKMEIHIKPPSKKAIIKGVGLATAGALTFTHPVEAGAALQTVKDTVDLVGDLPFAVIGGLLIGAEELLFEGQGRGFRNPQILPKVLTGALFTGTLVDTARVTAAAIDSGDILGAIRQHEDLLVIIAGFAVWELTKGLGEKTSQIGASIVQTHENNNKVWNDRAAQAEINKALKEVHYPFNKGVRAQEVLEKHGYRVGRDGKYHPPTAE